MRFAVTFIAVIGITSSWALKVPKPEDKGKREAAVGYASPSQAYQPQSYGQDANAISIGAGYSVGAKPSYSFGGLDSSALQSGLQSAGLHGLQPQLQSAAYQPAEGHQQGHGTIQLAPITLQPSQGLGSNDLAELMNQLSHGINSGAISLSPYQAQGQSGGQEYSQLSFGSPKYQLAEQSVQQAPSYAAGSKGLSSYSSTGPVLFNPSDSQGAQALAYNAPSAGHQQEAAAALNLGGSGHSLAGLSLGSGHSLGAPAYSLAGAGQSLGDSGYTLSNAVPHGAAPSFGSGYSLASGHPLGHSLGGSYKALSGGYSGKPSFKPSAYLGSSVQGDSGHGLSGLSGSYAGPSLGHAASGGHGLSLGSGGHAPSFGASFGPAKLSGYPKSQVFPSLEALMSQLSGQSSGSHGAPAASHAASSQTPQYYTSSSPAKYSFGEGSASYKGPSHGHSSLNSYSSPKYSFRPSRYTPKDTHGAYSETSYNTIKYSEELKPRAH